LAGIIPWAGLCAQAQTTEADISVKLKDKPLFLIGLWADDKLKFDAQGHPFGSYKTAPFTVCGMHVAKVSLHGSHLKLEGEREGITFDREGTMTRQTMMVSAGPGPNNLKPEKLSVEIDNGNGSDFSPAIDAVLTEDPGRLTPTLPEMWQPYFKKHFSATQIPVQTNSAQPAAHAARAEHIGGTVHAPKLIHNVEPEFNEYARRLKYSGNVQIYLWVDEDGSTSHVSVVRPAGMGLDEKAVEAVKQYRFSPATRDGKPIKVDLYIDVNFQIF
jgi:TonB family protein